MTPTGEILFSLVSNHHIFHCLNLGLFRQGLGFSMRCAPSWAKLVLRCLEARFWTIFPLPKRRGRIGNYGCAAILAMAPIHPPLMDVDTWLKQPTQFTGRKGV